VNPLQSWKSGYITPQTSKDALSRLQRSQPIHGDAIFMLLTLLCPPGFIIRDPLRDESDSTSPMQLEDSIKTIVAPILLNGNHWILVIGDRLRTAVSTYDSLREKFKWTADRQSKFFGDCGFPEHTNPSDQVSRVVEQARN